MVDNEKHDAAKRMFQEGGMSKAAIARQLNVSPQSIGKWAKADGWGKQGGGPVMSESPAFAPNADSTSFDPAEFARNVYADANAGIANPDHPDSATRATEPQSSVAELQTEIIALQARNDELAEENTRLKPTTDITEILENRVAWLTTNTPEGDQFWINRAELAWTDMTRERISRGLEPFRIKEHPEMFQETIDDLKAKEATIHDAEPTEPPSRKIKLAIYRGGKDAFDSEGGMLTIEQIPLEGQINNTAGSLADGIIRYTRKGFKITDPFLCPRAGCFKPAAVDEFNKWKWDGYHSEAHRNEVEVDQGIDLTGVVVRDHGVLSGAS